MSVRITPALRQTIDELQAEGLRVRLSGMPRDASTSSYDIAVVPGGNLRPVSARGADALRRRRQAGAERRLVASCGPPHRDTDSR